MPSACTLSFRFCRAVPATISRSVPTGPQWAFAIKHDGFRFLVVRQAKRVRVYSRAGHDWSKQLPAIAEALLALPVRSVIALSPIAIEVVRRIDALFEIERSING